MPLGGGEKNTKKGTSLSKGKKGSLVKGKSYLIQTAHKKKRSFGTSRSSWAGYFRGKDDGNKKGRKAS